MASQHLVSTKSVDWLSSSAERSLADLSVPVVRSPNGDPQPFHRDRDAAHGGPAIALTTLVQPRDDGRPAERIPR
jgi:hypothetical protein